MKKIIVAVTLVTLIATAHGQSVSNNLSNSAFAEAYDVNGKPFTSKSLENIEGSPMFSTDWNLANITFSNGKIVKNIPVQFNLEDNQLYFKKGDTILLFADPVASFQFAYTNDNAKKLAYFRNGYPSIQKNTGDTYYQVLADGPMQLLKYSYKSIAQRSDYNQVKYEYQLWQNLFAYNASTHVIIKIKDKSSLTNAFPVYAKAINDFAVQKNSKLKSTQSMIMLMNAGYLFIFRC
jgi:hypothetical protein